MDMEQAILYLRTALESLPVPLQKIVRTTVGTDMLGFCEVYLAVLHLFLYHMCKVFLLGVVGLLWHSTGCKAYLGAICKHGSYFALTLLCGS
eukprot:4045866-Amphidinium_carterae.1